MNQNARFDDSLSFFRSCSRSAPPASKKRGRQLPPRHREPSRPGFRPRLDERRRSQTVRRMSSSRPWTRVKSAINHSHRATDPDRCRPISFPSALIHDWLYIGDASHARSAAVLAQLGITHVVNAAGEIANAFPDQVVYCNDVRGIRDSPEFDLSAYFDPVCGKGYIYGSVTNMNPAWF